MKSILKHVMAALILFILLLGFSQLNSVTASTSKVVVCPGSGNGCALWGALEKGDNRGFLEITKQDKESVE